MAAEKTAATQNKLVPELSEIPLSLEQGDVNAVQSQKAKTNSLKRFFRKSKSQENQGTGAAPPKDSASLQLRFGTFHKHDGKGGTNDMASSSSKSVSSESKVHLPERLSAYWNNVFKRTPRRSLNPAASEQGDAPPADAPPIEHNATDM